MTHRLKPRLWQATLFALALGFGGCAKPPAESAPGVQKSPGAHEQVVSVVEPAPRLDRASANPGVAHTYRQTSDYSDKAVITLSYQIDDGRVENAVTTLKSTFSRPNHIRLELASEDNQVHIVSNGRQLAARIIDPTTNNFDGQHVIKPAPSSLSVDDLYAAAELVDPQHPEGMLSALLGSPVGLDQTPLSLALGQSRLADVLDQAHSVTTETGRVDSATLAGCSLLKAMLEEGEYLIWVDAQTNLIRRMEFPPADQQLPSGVTRIQLTIDFQDVSVAPADDQTFQVDDSWGEHRVRHFVLPPLEDVSDLLGESIPNFSMANLLGQPVMFNGQAQETTVLVWFHDHPASRFVLERLAALRESNRTRPRVFGVCVDQRADPAALLRNWNVSLDCLKDPQLVGRDILKVAEAPTTLILDNRNRLHYFEVGANPNIVDDVNAALAGVAAGENVGALIRQQSHLATQAYQDLLAAAKTEHSGGPLDLPEQKLPKATSPQKLTLRQVWSNTQIQDPGNMLVLPGRHQRILVVDGWNQIALLKANGELERRVRLDLPADEGVSFVRAGKDQQDRPLVACASRGARSAFVFDLSGDVVLRHPSDPSHTEDAIGDVLLADIDRDGRPELIVGWQGDGGLECVDLRGRRLWSNRAVSGIGAVSQAADSDRPALLCAGQSGLVALVDGSGRTLREMTVGSIGIHQIVAWPGRARGFEAILHNFQVPAQVRQAPYCGFGLSVSGKVVALGISSQFQTSWRRSLSPGIFRHQIDSPQTIDLPDIGPTWLLPGPDGSVQFVSIDGQFRDGFQTGAHLGGISSMQTDAETVLLLATDALVTGYGVTVD